MCGLLFILKGIRLNLSAHKCVDFVKGSFALSVEVFLSEAAAGFVPRARINGTAQLAASDTRNVFYIIIDGF